MSKLNIVIATHGRFGEELVKSAEMLVGKTENVYSLSLLPQKSFEDFMKETDELLDGLEGPIIGLVDLFGGTPSNVLTVLTQKYNFSVITGLSLPMFIDLYLSISAMKQVNVEEIVEATIKNMQSAVLCTNEQLEKAE